jgi:hypothetical protein
MGGDKLKLRTPLEPRRRGVEVLNGERPYRFCEDKVFLLERCREPSRKLEGVIRFLSLEKLLYSGGVEELNVKCLLNFFDVKRVGDFGATPGT